MDFCIPRYILHDFRDQEESKVIQMILNYAHIPYEFKEVDQNDYILEDYPFYSLPMLQIDEKKLGNVPSICRQLAWRYDLTCGTHSEDSQVDMVSEKVFAVRMKLKNWLDHIQHVPHHECDETCSEANALSLLSNYLFPILEGTLKKNNDPWLIGERMTWADLLTACLVNPVIYHLPHLFEKFPLVYLHNQVSLYIKFK
ncbi:hypothetical protein WR25_02182 [Diploscapter pachys]|uniref:GST C-terminal domain-containing protein n=1 Tax=Diploscapter pachys TaxID=2018661 RepID=A0A2A2KR33_9BILA|nr:hypothetical protein WR25_02182 [Diploscapter pachys]